MKKQSFTSFSGTIRKNTIGLPQFESTVTETFTTTKTMMDSGGHRRLGNGWSGGGAFDVTKSELYSAPCVMNLVNGGKYTKGTTAPLGFVSGGHFNVADASEPSELDLLALGATAIARTIPTNPSFSLLNALGEAGSDGLPRLVGLQTLKERSKYLRNSGDEYLNVEFGWLPLINDLKNFARSVKNAGDILNSYHKGSGLKIRRRYNFPSQDTTDFISAYQAGNGGIRMHPDISTFPGGNASRTTSNKTWFSGAYRYHIPMGDDLLSRFKRNYADADKLLGIKLTPESVWNLAPWSWAADWFSNTGDVMTNITRLGHDGLVLEYGFIMNRFMTETQWFAAAPAGGTPSSTVERYTHLRRRVATPYGFGFDMKALSASQDAVLVALGLSHGLR